MILINVGGEVAEMIESGRGVFICTVAYDVQGDALILSFPSTMDTEEGAAILKRFNALPEGSEIRKST
jgi:hypothetical protein